MTRSIADASADFAQLAQEAWGAQQSVLSQQNALGRLRLLAAEFLATARPPRVFSHYVLRSDRSKIYALRWTLGPNGTQACVTAPVGTAKEANRLTPSEIAGHPNFVPDGWHLVPVLRSTGRG